MIVPHWGGHGLPVPLFFDGICLSAVGPEASHPPEDSQELQLECSRWEGVWYTSTRQSAFLADTCSLGGVLFQCTSEFQQELVTVFQESTICQRLDAVHCAGTSGLLGLQGVWACDGTMYVCRRKAYH